jgi:Big-like domain-containing protein
MTYTATVSPTDDGGTVTFTYGGGTLPGCGAVSLNGSGQATCSIIWVSGGTTTVHATYSGDTGYAASTSNCIVQVVGTGKKPTTTAVVSSANPVTVGKIVIYTATVTPAVYGGTVKFTYGGGTLPACGAVALNSSGEAECAIIWISSGTTSIEAAYSGSTGYAGSTSSAIDQVVDPAFTATASPVSIAYGHADKLSASGLPSGSTGTVTFNSNHGTLCKATVSATKASCMTGTALIPGVYNVTAKYAGNKPAATATASFLITKAIPPMTAKASPVSTTYGHAVTVSVSGLPAKATGSVTFTYSGGTLCKATVSAGKASCQSPKTVPVGKYTVTATYSGNTDYYSITAKTTFTITKSAIL